NNAGWWRDGNIDDNSFLHGIEFLIKEGILQIPPTTQGSGGSEIPSWIKENAGWWAEGKISDDDFIYGVNYLVNQGIILVDV
ncbi:MAG: peptidase, partial [Candidatus Nitrosomaritimum yanchengensis]